jgi:hypothetical protein
MKVIEIKSKKQDNGIWGMPLNCYGIEGSLWMNDEILISAIIMAVDEKYNKNFKLTFYKNNNFLISVKFSQGEEMFFIKLEKYEIINNTLYEFDNEKEHLVFLRQKKIKQLENFLK